MEKLEKLFDAIDARMPANDWDGFATDLQSLMDCEFVAYYSVKMPVDIELHAPKIVMASHPKLLADFWTKGIYKMQFVNEDALPAFAPFKSMDVVDPEVLAQHPVYTEWGRHCGFFHILFAPLLVSSFELLMLAVGRPKDATDFDGQDSYRLGLAARYLRQFVQAQQIAQPIESIELSNYFTSPVAIVQGSEVLSANDSFRDWCRTNGMIQIGPDGKQLAFQKVSLEAKISKARTELGRSPIDPAQPPKSQVSLNIGQDGSDNYTLQIMPLVGVNAHKDRTIWFVHNANPNLAVAKYGTQVGLTPTEIQILSHLARGISARSISEITDRSYTTTRWHVQNILSKCGAQNQKELLYKLFSEAEQS